MHNLRSFVPTALAIIAAAGFTAAARADINPWDFNVFSRSTIGSASTPYGSDYQGAAGAVGNAWFNGFSLRAVAGSSPSLPQSWYGGGTLSFGGQFNNGGIESAGTVTMNSAALFGNIRSGGDLAGTSGSVNGSATLAGTKTAPGSLTVTGGVTPNTAFAPTVSLSDVSAFFLAQSNAAAAMADTTSASIVSNVITVNTVAGTNVVTISGLDLLNAHTFNVNGPGTLIVNVTGASPTLDSTTWNYAGGASSRTTLLNYNQATTLMLPDGSGNVVNILAPNAATTFLSGHVDGNLIVGSLMGRNSSGGQVNWPGGGFNGLIPTPAAGGLLAMGGLAAFRRRR